MLNLRNFEIRVWVALPSDFLRLLASDIPTYSGLLDNMILSVFFLTAQLGGVVLFSVSSVINSGNKFFIYYELNVYVFIQFTQCFNLVTALCTACIAAVNNCSIETPNVKILERPCIIFVGNNESSQKLKR